jgi:hypothetical protein
MASSSRGRKGRCHGIEDVSPALQARLGPDATTGLLALLEATRQEWQSAFAEASAFAAATADKSTIEADVTAAAIERFERRLTEEVGGIRGEMRELQDSLRGEMRALHGGLRGEMLACEARLREEMRDLTAELREEGRANTAALREEMRNGTSTVRIELKEDVNTPRVQVKDEMSKVRVDVADALSKARVDMMRWSFSLCVGQVVATAAIVGGVFRVFAQ